MNDDGLEGLPVASSLGGSWRLARKIEDYAAHVVLHEINQEGKLVLTPEDDGIPCFLLYGPKATIKMRCESIAIANQFLTMFYNREPAQVVHHHSKLWALVPSIDGGIIPLKHHVIRDQEFPVADESMWNKEIFDAGLLTQPYGND
jgi:hypothetical protein